MKKAVKAIGPETPIFGVDTEEIEALRQLEKFVGDYLKERVSISELEAAYYHIKRVRRTKLRN